MTNCQLFNSSPGTAAANVVPKHNPTTRLPRYFSGSVIVINLTALLYWTPYVNSAAGSIPAEWLIEGYTAVFFLFSAISLWLLSNDNVTLKSRCLSIACSGVTALFGAFISSGYLFGIETEINQLFFSALPTVVGIAGPTGPNGMAISTAFYFSLIGAALACLDLLHNKLTYLLTVIVSILTALALIGYAYGLTGMPRFAQMALPVAICFALLCAGILIARPDNTLVNTLDSKGIGGFMARRLLPAAIILPLVLGWLRILGEKHGLYDTSFGAALLVLLMIVTLSALIGFTAKSLDRIDAGRIEAENVLRETQRRTRLIIDRAYDAFVAIDHDSVITDWNSEAEATFGWTREEALGKKLTETIIPDRFRKAHAAGLERYLKIGHGPVLNQRIEIPAVHKDGHEFPVELAVFPLVVGDTPSFCAFLHDITERTKNKERLEATTRKLEQSNRDLQQFAYVAAHDLREPLRTIRSYLDLIAPKLKPGMDEDTKENMAFIIEATQRMQMLITDLLSYARVDTQGKEFQSVDCSVVVAKVLVQLQTAIKESHRQLTYDHLPTVIADENQLFQVFSNLIGNAFKFAGEHPPKVHVGAHQSGDEWIFSVRDNGIGFDMSYAERIFEMFQRLHGIDEFQGTGIGLAICKKIIERHGGRIWVESQPDQGSTFYFSLPYNQS